MKNVSTPKNNPHVQGGPMANRAHHDIKVDKKQNGISNAGGQRSDQTSNRDNERKRENK